MCRFVLYMGPELGMSSLVTEPAHSIVVQSYRSEEREEPLNGDGFGVAWYPLNESIMPGVFRSLSPAWSNRNLASLARVIRSQCMLAHVRAASPGLPVTELNCHPFVRDQFCFMHNGGIGNFSRVKRKMSRMLSDSSYDWIKGTTDSEYIFALFADEFSTASGDAPIDRAANAMISTISTVEDLRKSAGIDAPCDLNLAVTGGRSAVVSRYSSKGKVPNSLHIHTGHRYSCDAGAARLTPCESATVLVASEALTQDSSWQTVEPNHLLVIDESLDVDIRPIKIHS